MLLKDLTIEQKNCISSEIQFNVKAEAEASEFYFKLLNNVADEDKETISAQYQAYHALGGDTFITDLKNQVMNLPIEKVQKERKSTKKVLNETL